MFLLFESPAMTGKTQHAEALRKHFGADVVVEFDNIRNMTAEARYRAYAGKDVLVLAQSSEGAQASLDCSTLSREARNQAMMAVGGHRIWNEDGSRFEVKFV